MKQYFVGFDWLRIIAAIGIVGCHLTLPNMTEGAYAVKRFTDLNVGVFAAVAGFFTAYSLQCEQRFVSFLKHRMFKLLVPLYCWSLLYIGIDVIFDLLMGHQLTFQPKSIEYWYLLIFLGRGAIQTWFLIALFYTQILCYHIIKKTTLMSHKVISFVFLFLSIGGILYSHQGGWWTYYFLRLLSFFLLGVVIFRERTLLQRISLFVIYALIFVGILFIANGFRYGFLGECVLSIPMLLWGLKFDTRRETIKNLGNLLGKLSFGVYLIHPLFARFFDVLLPKLDILSTGLVFCFDLCIVTMFLLISSYLLFVLIKRYPKLSFIMPS